MKDHIFFDLDGTLTDSMPGITRAVSYALRHFGIIEDNYEVLRPFVGPPLQDSFIRYYNFTPEDAAAAVPVFREYYTERGWKENSVYDGMEDALKALKDGGKRLYVATSKPEVMAVRILEHFGLAGYFDRIGGATMDGSRERKVDVIHYVMKESGLHDRNKIIMVGDREHDIIGAHKAGLDAVAVLYGYGEEEELRKAEPEYYVPSPEELSRLLLLL